ncbi:HdeD family acid-resistance protein [Entomobacter blattae]|uniref:Acid-resistance membrane protein n=1 Tax=Entomobacter blattae TaxID=2762277 RepID=A0A7H1NSB7_9PROT|nr:HdeD family acid-resistance protein [Entomobacter blattae]QNT78677.1 hypothetical protein JGUZn3_14530 [Entomobacter blattae]
MTPLLATHWKRFYILGMICIALGVFALIDTSLATLASVIMLGLLLIIAGMIQIYHSFSVKEWSSFIFSFGIGVLYCIGGILLMKEPVTGSIFLTAFIALCFILGGAMRAIIATRHTDLKRWWVMLLSGLLSMLVGAALYILLPWSGLWVLGTLLGIDLIFSGASWLNFGMILKQQNENSP